MKTTAESDLTASKWASIKIEHDRDYCILKLLHSAI